MASDRTEPLFDSTRERELCGYVWGDGLHHCVATKGHRFPHWSESGERSVEGIDDAE